MSRFRAVAWDIDGTLIDSEPLHQRALVESSAAFGADLSDLPDEAFRGTHMLDVWKALRPRFAQGTDVKTWLAAIERHYVAQAGGLAASPGALDTMLALAELGVPQACVSNSGRAVVDANLNALGIRDKIAFSISLDDVSKGKPDPEPFREAARRFGLPAASVVAVEDSAAGARSAKEAGLFVVGYAPDRAVPNCDRLVTALPEILALFDRQPVNGRPSSAPARNSD